MASPTDTIFAIASGAGRSAVAILRLSGPHTASVVSQVCGVVPSPRRASLRMLRDQDGSAIDKGLVLWFPGPASFTGEDCAELQVHGGPAVVNDLAFRLVGLGLRPAEPGEFTRRAFLNGRMDLVEAEGLADLVDAETTAQRRQALRQLDGELSRLFADWMALLMELLAHQEALIDFPDEDIPQPVEARLRSRLDHLHDDMRRHLDEGRHGERLREGLVFAIVGAPNAGKSTLLNALARREVAIVSPQPGTTRDVLEARVDLAGVPVTLLDTAGIRTSADPIETEGVRRALAAAERADVVIEVQSPDHPPPALLPTHAHVLRVAAKSDLGLPAEPAAGPDRPLPVSAVTGAGMDDLSARLRDLALQLTRSAGTAPLTRPRHRAALLEAVQALDRARTATYPELRAEDLRLAMRSLGRITGYVILDDILDLIFGQFCIGK